MGDEKTNDDEGTDDTGTGGDSGTGGGDTGSEARFTQADLDRIAGETRKAARKAAEKDLADSLGVTVDEAKQIIAAKREADEAAMSEAEKARKAAEKAQREAEEQKAEARRARVSADVTLALTESGLADRKVRDSAAVLVMARLDGDDVDADTINEAVESVKAEVPQLWASADGTPPPPPRSGDPGTGGRKPPAGGQAQSSARERGAARARALQGRSE